MAERRVFLLGVFEGKHYFSAFLPSLSPQARMFGEGVARRDGGFVRCPRVQLPHPLFF